MSGDNPYPWRQGRSQPQIDVSNQSNQPHMMGSQQQSALETGGVYVAKQPTLHYGSGSGAKPARDVGSSYVPKQHYVPPPKPQEMGSMYGPPPTRKPGQQNSTFNQPKQPKPVHPRDQELGTMYTPKPGSQIYSGPDYQAPPQMPSYQPRQQQQQQQQPQQQQYQPQYQHQQSQPEGARKITQISIGQLTSPSPQQTPAQPQFPEQQYQQPQPYQPQQQQQYQPPQQQYQPQQQQYQPPQQQYEPKQQQYQPPQQQYQQPQQQYQPPQQQYQQPQQQYQPPQQQYQPPQQQYQPQYQSSPSIGQSVSSPAEYLDRPQFQNQPQPQFNQQPASMPPRRRGKFTGSVKVFTPEQVERYRRVFNAFDVNRNGVLEANELLPVARELGYRLPKEQFEDILRSFDLDAYGILTFDEFLEAMPGNYDLIPEDEHRRAEIRHKFQEFDRDCNGYISRDEAYSVLFKELGFDREKSNSLINQFDINADGQLSYEEFIGFYMKVRERKDAIDVAFRQFDRDNKGYVSMEDAKKILSGQLFTDYEVERIVKAHDTNRDGKLQYEEFVHFWTA